MGRYSVFAEVDTVEGDCMLLLSSDGVVLPEILEIRIGFSSAPDDQRFEFAVREHTSEGAGGTAVTPAKFGPVADAACSAKAGPFSGDPALLSAPRRLTISPHRRSTEVWKAGKGEGLRPQGLAAGRGISIWCVKAPSNLKALVTMEFEE